MQYFSQKKSQGFTLVEMLVSILLFSAAVTTLATVISRGVQDTADLQTETIATFLAAEGVELVRNRRDRNYIQPATNWLNGLYPECDEACDTGDAFPLAGNTGTVFEACSSYPCASPLTLTLKDTGGTQFGAYYDISTVSNPSLKSPSPYTRTITVKPIRSDGLGVAEVEVVSLVQWQQGNRTREVSYTTFLTRWRAGT